MNRKITLFLVYCLGSASSAASLYRAIEKRDKAKIVLHGTALVINLTSATKTLYELLELVVEFEQPIRLD